MQTRVLLELKQKGKTAFYSLVITKMTPAMFKKIFFTGIGVLALIGFLIVFFMIGKPAVAQAQELFNLYFDIDHIRRESAEIFAELLEIRSHPERVGGEEKVGSPPPLANREVLISRIKQNREEVARALSTVAAFSFSAEDVSLSHLQVRSFYDDLAALEDVVTTQLSRPIPDEEAFAELIDNLFERWPHWEDLLAKDREMQKGLVALSESYGLEFELESYDDIFRARLVELRAPVLSDEFGEVRYDFEIAPDTLQHNLSASWSGSSVDRFRFSLKHPDGRIMRFEIIKPPETGQVDSVPLSYIPTDGNVVRIPNENITQRDINAPKGSESLVFYENTWVMFNFFPDDSVLAPIEGAWQLIVRAPGGIEIVFGSSGIPRPK